MVIGLDIFLVDVSSLMRIDVMIWVAGIPVVFFLLVILLYQVRQYRQLKVELVQLAAINRHSIEYELVLKAMKLSTWRIDVAEGVVSYESDYRSKTNSLSHSRAQRLTGCMT